MKKLRIAIDFRVADLRQGAGTSTLALAYGLSRLPATDQEYIFIVLEQNKEYFLSCINGPCSLVTVKGRQNSLLGKFKNIVKRLPLVQRAWLTLHPGDTFLPASDGTAEKLHCDLVHFPAQAAYTTSLPTIYQPWDLQFCHHPEFFTPDDLRVRKAYYEAFCRRAACVCVQTEWTKQDVITQFDIASEKIAVIRWGTAFEAYQAMSDEDLDSVRGELNLPTEFFLYPAVTWPHKNHQLILQALAVLKQSRSYRARVVFTGAINDHGAHLQALAEQLGVSEQVQFVGFVTEKQIQATFRLAKALVFPSRFEGLGLPVLEAFRVGLPVICSSATVLPEVTNGAALLVDPDSAEQLADLMAQVRHDEALCAELVRKGKAVLRNYSSETTAKQFRDLYASIAARNDAQR